MEKERHIPGGLSSPKGEEKSEETGRPGYVLENQRKKKRKKKENEIKKMSKFFLKKMGWKIEKMG